MDALSLIDDGVIADFRRWRAEDLVFWDWLESADALPLIALGAQGGAQGLSADIVNSGCTGRFTVCSVLA